MMAPSINDQKALDSQHVEHMQAIDDLREAAEASAAEHNTTFWQAIAQNKKAAFWSAVISMTIVMEGYDVGLIYQFFAYPAFQKTFGNYYPGTGWQVSGPWQAGLSNGANAGIILGGFANGYLSQRFGYKRTILGALFFMNWFIFVLFFATTRPVLLTGQILCGLAWGVFATTGPAYASEVCPLSLRGYLTCFVNMCWAIGQLIAAGVLYGCLKIDGTWAYRTAYAVQWVWPVPLLILILFAPESPWFLIRNERYEEAEKALSQLDNKSNEEHKKTISQINHTLAIEEKMESGSSYLDLFKGVDRRRTEIVCMTFAGQVMSGSTFAYGPTYFFQQAGIDTNDTYGIAVGGTGIAFIGTIISWILISRFGRRTLYLTGMCLCCLYLLLIGIIASATDAQGARWGQVALCLIWLFTYSMTIGPICYCIISETSSMRLRAKSVCLSRNVYNIVQIIANVIEPYLINPTEANLKGKTGYFWACTALLAAVWTYFRLPEARGRTYEELDVMFERRVPARKFAAYELDIYEQELSEAKGEVLRQE